MEPVPRVVLKMEVLQILENYIENSFIIFSGPAIHIHIYISDHECTDNMSAAKAHNLANDF